MIGFTWKVPTNQIDDKNPYCYTWYQIFAFYFVKLGSIQKSQQKTHSCTII